MIRRSFLFLFFGALVASHLCGQSAKTIRTYGIKMKTEVVKIYEGELELARYIEEIEFYNEEGDWVEKKEYDEGGELKSLKKRVYDNGELIEEIEMDPDGSKIKAAKPPSYEHRRFAYEKGDLISEEVLDEAGKVLKTIEYRYNKFGDLEEVMENDAKGNVLVTERTEYDDRGLKVKEIILYGDGRIKKEKSFIYE